MATLHPDFIAMLKKDYPQEAEQMLAAIATEPSVAVRLNSRKPTDTPLGATAVEWSKGGYRLAERPRFTFDPLLHAGCYYVQDPSSMFIAEVIRQSHLTSPISYLDLCAAPGGKTTAAIDALPEGSLVVANEIDGRRAQILCENVIKWGYPAVVVTNSDARKLGKLKEAFDVVAADMPCSGEGMMRKDEEAVEQWTPKLVEQCAARQQEIADDIWKALKPGGLFIYSTCTFNRRENEDVVKYLIDEYDAEPIALTIQPGWGIYPTNEGDAPGYHFFPHRVNGEGLYMAVVRKPGEQRVAKGGKQDKKKQPPQCSSYINNPERYEYITDNGIVSAIPTEWSNLAAQIRKTANTILCGIRISETKGKDLVPCHSLALSTSLNKEAFQIVELDHATALSYLRGETFTLSTPRGYVVVTYKGYPLGFIKQLGNRINNCYPKEWRIRSQIK